MASIQNVLITKWLANKWQVHNLGRQDEWLAKWLFSKWLVAKWLVSKMMFWQNDNMRKLLIDKITRWPNDR